MALSPKLELRQSQGLVMTPQLMQAIKLLQMSSLDLAAYVESELERNPLLEHDSEEQDGDGTAPRSQEQAAAEPGDLVSAARDGSVESITENLDADFGNVYDSDTAAPAKVAAEPPPDSGWAGVRGDRRGFDGDGDSLESTVAAGQTLHEHLLSQILVAIREAPRRLIARHLVDLIDEAGYLTEGIETIAERLGAREDDVAAVLSIVQTCDPPGVGARDLAECLAIQLKERDRFDPAMQSLISNLDLLARRDMAELRRRCGVDEEDIVDMVEEIRRLDPKPGHAFGGAPVQPVIPDVFVRPRPDGGWLVELNTETLPRVLVDQTYYATVSQGMHSAEDKAYLSECLQQANWLVRSLDQRARTILKVASEIVRQQDMFLAKGVRHLRPLNLRGVADAIDMHESTVSRVTANKYMSTPRGIFELKYFFTTAIAGTGDGVSHSAEAVRHRIREMIDAESPDDVLSDDAIVARLRDDGIDIARRTVAKYRESLKISSSVQRRREKRAGG
jgi:RNA polymerase sigma-54 factor